MSARLGFYEVGRLHEVGFKFGRWLDLVLFELILGAPETEEVP
jgi:phosphinothricin acetyltransferase